MSFFPAGNVDYRSSQTTSFTLSNGRLEICIFIPIINDNIFEFQKGFFFNLTTKDRDVILNPHSVVVNIVDDESEFQNL